MQSVRAPLTGTPRKDGRWQITVTLHTPWGGRKRVVLYARTQKEVQAKARALLSQGRTKANEYTLAELWDVWEEARWPALSESAREQYRYAAKRILPEFGQINVTEITRPQIYQWTQRMAADPRLSGRTVQVHRNVLRVCLEHACNIGWLGENPAKGWRAPIQAKPAPQKRLTAEEIDAAIAAAQGRERLFLRLLWETAVRPQEATLCCSQHLLDEHGLSWLLVPGTKTAKARRTVPLSPELRDALLELPEPWFPWQRRQITELWHRVQISLGWRPQRGKRGARVQPDQPLPTLYQIRKARIAAWKDLGVSDEVWAELAGHEDVRLTRAVYDRVSRTRIAGQLGLSLSNSLSEKGKPVDEK